jgi:hypothetical protein
VDIIRRPHTEDDGTKENAGGEHRPELKAHRRCYSAKGVQYGVITRLAFLIWQTPATPANSSPASLRGFSLMLAYFGRRYVNLLRMAGFAWHLYPETPSKSHLSNARNLLAGFSFASNRTSGDYGISICFHHRARRSYHNCRIPEDDRSDGRSCQAPVPGSPSHAPALHWLQARQRWA